MNQACSRALPALAAASLLALGESEAAFPSFDCARASNPVEVMICNDAELAGLDRSLSDLYGILVGSSTRDQRRLLKAEQRGWLAGRNACWQSDDMRGCILNAYRVRIDDLKGR